MLAALTGREGISPRPGVSARALSNAIDTAARLLCVVSVFDIA
jgi:hypothetical protein